MKRQEDELEMVALSSAVTWICVLSGHLTLSSCFKSTLFLQTLPSSLSSGNFLDGKQ